MYGMTNSQVPKAKVALTFFWDMLHNKEVFTLDYLL